MTLTATLGLVASAFDGNDMRFLLQNSINALSYGSLYALFALGIALIFGIMQLINFAHGELIMVGAYAIVLFDVLPWPVLLPLIFAIVIVFALAMERIAFRPVRGSKPGTLLITSFAVSYLIQNLATVIFGALPRSTSFGTPLSQSITIGQISVARYDIVTVVVAFALLALLGAFLSRTRMGVEMRAAAEDFRMARVLGVNANVVIAVAFAISGVLAAAALGAARDPDRVGEPNDGRDAGPSGVRGDGARRHRQPTRGRARRLPARDRDRRAPGVPPARAALLPRRVRVRRRDRDTPHPSSGARRRQDDHHACLSQPPPNARPNLRSERAERPSSNRSRPTLASSP